MVSDEYVPIGSEVRALLDQIEQEYWSAQQGLSGFAVVGRHRRYQARMEKIEELADALEKCVPPGRAWILITGRIAESGQVGP